MKVTKPEIIALLPKKNLSFARAIEKNITKIIRVEVKGKVWNHAKT